MNHNIFSWCIFAACLALSFLLSGMEAGVFALSRLRVRQQMRAGRRSAQVLHEYLEHPETFLWTILVGNTLANFLILGWLVVVLHQALAHHLVWFVCVYVAFVFLFYTFFDLLPKMLFRRHPNRLCLSLARPFRVIDFGLRLLVKLVEWVSGLLLRWRGGRAFTSRLFGNREELRWVMQQSAQAFTSEERTMINRVLDLQSLTVRQIMKPSAEAVTLPAGAPTKDALKVFREHNFSRIPICDDRDGQTRVVGFVILSTLLYQSGLDLERPVREHLKPALYLDEDTRLEVALRRMQRSGLRLAIVLGRDHRESGIIGLQDVLRVIFGEVNL